MKARSRVALGALGLSAAAAGVVAWAYLSVERPARAERARRAGEERVLPFEPGEAREVRVDAGGGSFRLFRSGGGWTVADPREAPADPAAVAAFLERLSSVRRTSALDARDRGLREFGLEPPRARVVVELRGGRTISLDIGADNPFDRTLFARAGGPVLVLPGSARVALGADAASLRQAPTPDGGNGG